MSDLLERINAEQERIEQQCIQSQLSNCCEELEKIMIFMRHELREYTQDSIIKNNLLRIKDMHDFIYANPTLKGDLKELTWLRYIEIYKANHPTELTHKIDHDMDPDTEKVTVEAVIDLMVDAFAP